MVHRKEKPITDNESELIEKFNHLRYLVTLVEGYKTGIYSRAQMILAITGAQLALTMSLLGVLLQKLDITHIPIFYSIPFALLIIISIIFQLINGMIIINTILPHKNLKIVSKIIKKKTKKESEFTWLLSAYNHVANKTMTEYKELVNNSTLQDLFEDLNTYYFNLCHIVSRRYYILRKGSILQITNFIFLIIIIILSFILMAIYK